MREQESSAPTSPLRLVPTTPDSKVASELKAKLQAALMEVCATMDEANAAGFDSVQFSIGKDYAGKACIAQLVIAKHY